jgi:3-oxoacyl-[acyl-carrier-protein] synthase III
MALHFFTSSESTLDVVVTCDPAITASDEAKNEYLKTGDRSLLGDHAGATIFTIKALGPNEREEAEVKAGAYTRSELGRLLWSQQPSETEERARWHHALEEDERAALAHYRNYLDNVYLEMVNASLQTIDGQPASIDQVQMIQPDDARIVTISELVLHIRRISLLGDSGK